MQRRHFIKGTALTGGAYLATTSARKVSAASKRFRWRMAMVVPKTLKIWGPEMVKFSERIEIMSEGRLRIKVYGAGELVPPLEVFDTVKNGGVQMGHSASYYWQGKIPASVFFTSIPFGMNANGMMAWITAGGGQELWDELYAPHQVKAFPCGNTGVQMGGWFKKEVNTLADFKGLKMRMPGLGGQVIAKAGAKPILLPGGEIFTSLETGVIDATEWVGPYHDTLMGFNKVAPFYYSGGWHEPGSVLELIINKTAWESLPEDLKLIVSSCAAETNTRMFSHWLTMDSIYYKKLKTEGRVKFREYSPDITKKMKEYAKEVVQEVAKSSPLAQKIYHSFSSFQKEYEDYQELSERAYVKAQKA